MSATHEEISATRPTPQRSVSARFGLEVADPQVSQYLNLPLICIMILM